MTEEEWLRQRHDPHSADFLARGSERKKALFGCACCRRLWDLLEEYGQLAVEAVEDFVDGRASRQAVAERMEDAGLVEHLGWPSEEQRGAARSVCHILDGQAAYSALFAREDRELERRAQYLLLRDLYGLPMPPSRVDPRWLAWDEGTVRKMAEAIYAERAWERMPVLGDALEEAGCDDRAILDHCRGPGPHARGCWVLDLLLGRG